MQKETITVGPAKQSDLKDILSLLAESNLPTDGLSEHIAGTLVARDGDRILGSAALEVYGSSALLRSVAVAETARGHGLGTLLTRAALDLAAALDVRDVYLLTETAGDFFSRFGFTPTTRADVPADVHQSVEFTTACPDSALVLYKHLHP